MQVTKRSRRRKTGTRRDGRSPPRRRFATRATRYATPATQTDTALVGGLVAFGAYKMSTRDADRIKQDTGIDPEEMTDEELEASMTKLGIEKQYRDANDTEE